MAEGTGWIYLRDDRKRMKIGQTKDPVRRAYTYNTHNPDYRNLISVEVPSKDLNRIEGGLKSLLQDYWLVGREWFCRSAKVAETVLRSLRYDYCLDVDEYWGDGMSLSEVISDIGHQEATLNRFGVDGQDYQVGMYGSHEDVYMALVSLELHAKWRDSKQRYKPMGLDFLTMKGGSR